MIGDIVIVLLISAIVLVSVWPYFSLTNLSTIAQELQEIKKELRKMNK